VLLHWLRRHGFAKLVICHLNHSLRGRASTGDARFVERLARSNGFEFDVGHTDVATLAKDSRQSIEAAAREARYAFFALVARRRRCHTIFLGHHADDLVETFLINLFRGAGPVGLGAIRPVSKLRVARTELTVIRPLLGVWRDQIDEYVAAHRLEYREDASNRTFAAVRNRVRHELIPLIEARFDRNIRSSVWRAATLAAEEEAWLKTLVPPVAVNAPELMVAELRTLPVALQRRTIRTWLTAQKIQDVGFEVVEQVRNLLAQSRPAKINLPRDLHVRRRAKKIFIERLEAPPHS
jgi:tRNA(Ile)-lysidine synthase